VGWRPQEAFLGILGTGDPRVCVASRGALGLEGDWIWGLKVTEIGDDGKAWELWDWIRGFRV
jgi:hypothetical protein